MHSRRSLNLVNIFSKAYQLGRILHFRRDNILLKWVANAGLYLYSSQLCRLQESIMFHRLRNDHFLLLAVRMYKESRICRICVLCLEQREQQELHLYYVPSHIFCRLCASLTNFIFVMSLDLSQIYMSSKTLREQYSLYSQDKLFL